MDRLEGQDAAIERLESALTAMTAERDKAEAKLETVEHWLVDWRRKDFNHEYE